MRVSTTLHSRKGLGLSVLAVAAALTLIVSWLVTAVSASSVVQVTSNVADVPGGDSFVITVGTENDGDVYELEVDHSLASNPAIPEFSVYADEADPYGGDGALFAAAGVTVNYSATDNQWVIDFGDSMTQTMTDEAGGNLAFYFVLKDSAGDPLWGSMSPTTAENTFTFNLVDGSGDSLVPEVVDEVEVQEAVVPGVPNTSVIW